MKSNNTYIVLINISIILSIFGVVEAYFRLVEAPFISESHESFRLKRPEPYAQSHYFSTEFIKESFEQPGGWIIDKESRTVLPKNYEGRWFNVKENLRITENQPKKYKKRVLMFGGSTMYSSEVPDHLTIASQLQLLINDSNIDAKVINYGVTSIHSEQQALRLRRSVNLQKEDLVIFYDGVNDVVLRVILNKPEGFLADEPAKAPYLAKWIRSATKRSAFFRWIDRTLITVEFTDLNASRLSDAASSYLYELEKTHQYVASKGAKFFHFLQPNLYTKKSLTQYEVLLLENSGTPMIPKGFETAFKHAYPIFQSVLRSVIYSTDLTAVFDDLPHSPYLDFCHITEVGNSKIAEEIFNVLRNSL